MSSARILAAGARRPAIGSPRFRKALADKEVQDKLQGVGSFAAYRTADQTAERMRQDFERWGKVIRDNHITNQ